MLKKSPKFTNTAAVVLMFAAVFSLTGCIKTENTSLQPDNEALAGISELQQESPKVQTAAGIIKTLEKDAETEMETETGSIMRAYSDKEKERMSKLQESYQNETAKPRQLIQEVNNAGEVTEGTLCYILSTGEYYLPDRELTDEELLEIIDCNFRIAVYANSQTQEKVDEMNRKERAMLEEKVQAAGGLSEEQAIEIARKAMETDLGERGKRLELSIDEIYGWSSDLCVANWSEIKEEDRGEIAYSVGFNNAENGIDFKELLGYVCVVNAIDGSILEAYEIQGLGGSVVYYEH